MKTAAHHSIAPAELSAAVGVMSWVLCLFSPAIISAQPNTPSAVGAMIGTPAAAADTAIVYTPPRRGAPVTRVTAGTRASGDTATVAVLAPEDVGLTVNDQPTLYWFISEPTKARVEVTLISEETVDPLLEVPLMEVETPGINAIDLADYGIRLAPGALYRWSVAIVRDPNARSSDTLSSAIIERVAEDPSPVIDVTGKDALARAKTFAAAGIWYDAFSGVSALITQDPGNQVYRRARAQLLEQVGLPGAAAADNAFVR